MALVVTRNELLATEIRTAEPSHALVMLEGELDLSTSSQLFAEFAQLARDGIKHVALNLAELKFIDSSGLSVIIAEHKRAESMGGELVIFSPQPKVRRLFEVTGLDEFLNIRPRA